MSGGRTHDFPRIIEARNRRRYIGEVCRNLRDLQDESGQTDDTGQTGSGEDGLGGSAGGDGGRSGGNTGTGASRSGGSSVAASRRSLGGGADGAVGEGRGDRAAVAASGNRASRSSSTAMGHMLVAGFGLLQDVDVAYQVLQRTLLTVVTGRVMVQGQSVMVRVVGWRQVLLAGRFFRELSRFKS